jgi:hypothetical protein
LYISSGYYPVNILAGVKGPSITDYLRILYASSDCLGKWDGHMPWVVICDARSKKKMKYIQTIKRKQKVKIANTYTSIRVKHKHIYKKSGLLFKYSICGWGSRYLMVAGLTDYPRTLYASSDYLSGFLTACYC